MPKQRDYERFVLKKLLYDKYIGSRMTLTENIPKYVPSHEKRAVKRAVKKLIEKDFLLTKKKHYGVHVSVNPSKLEGIKEFLEKT